MLETNLCYHCKTNEKLPGSAFCSLACKDAYWISQPVKPKKGTTQLSTQELVHKVKSLGANTPHEEEPADFIAHIVNEPIQTQSLPYRDN